MDRRSIIRKVGEVPDLIKLRIEALSIAELEDLGEALLNFETLADLGEWLERLPR